MRKRTSRWEPDRRRGSEMIAFPRWNWVHRVGVSIALVLLVLTGVLLYGWQSQHWFTNLTYSMPVGVYSLQPVTQLSRGQTVEVCESRRAAALVVNREYVDHGDCWDGTEPLLKTVAGIGGDRIVVGASGVRVNGVLLPWSAPHGRDSRGRPLKPLTGTFVLAAHEVWLYSPHPLSFDSRYYGPVDRSLIRGVGVPVFVAAMKRD